MKEEIEDQDKMGKPRKEGPVGFAALEGANTKERDGLREVATRVVTNFNRLAEILEEWRSFRLWVIVAARFRFQARRPRQAGWSCEDFLGRRREITTACPSITFKNQGNFLGMVDVWKSFEKPWLHRS